MNEYYNYEELKDAMKAKGDTGPELALLLGKARTYIGHVFIGGAELTITEKRFVAQRYGLDIYGEPLYDSTGKEYEGEM